MAALKSNLGQKPKRNLTTMLAKPILASNRGPPLASGYVLTPEFTPHINQGHFPERRLIRSLILAESRSVSSKPISETDIDERNLFRRRGLLQESPRNGASEIQGCQEMLADRPTNLQIGLTADIARVTKIRWP
jgi:hypothetical protein